MKKVAVVAGALAIFAASASSADARGYSCSYKTEGAIFTIDGYDNNRVYCRAFYEGLGGARVARSSSAPIVCAWKLRGQDIYFTIRYPASRTLGRVLCQFMAEGGSLSDWRRIK